MGPDGTVRALAPPAGADRGSAKLITGNGWISGYVYVGGVMHVVRWDATGAVTDLGAPATFDNQANAIAPDGTVVGTSTEYYQDTSTPIDTWASAGTRRARGPGWTGPPTSSGLRPTT